MEQYKEEEMKSWAFSLKRISALLVFFTWISGTAFTQNSEPVFEAYADAKQVLSNNYFEVTFTLKNADGQRFSPPSFNDFVVLSGPARGVSTTIVNGRVSKEMTFSYTLQPKRIGRFTIGSANITVGGKSLRTKPFQIQVLEGKEGETNTGEQFYVKVVPNTIEAYVGQQIKLDYKLFTTVEIQNFNITEESDYVGFYAEDIQRPDTRRQQEIVDGVQYVTKVLKSMALYPQQAGVLKIDPAVIQLGVVVNNRRGSGFFFGSEIRRVAYTTEPLEIVVNPLPPDAPADFSGAVGDFAISAGISRVSVTTDDAITLRMVIDGDGDIKRLQVPKINFPESFEVYEPKVEEEDLGEVNQVRVGRKIIDYICLPKEAGKFIIEPTFTYFDTDSSQYVTLVDDTYELNVRQGTAFKTPIISDSNGQEDVQFISLDTRLRKSRKQFLGSFFFWLLLILPLGLLSISILYKRKLQEIANIDPALLKSQKAKKVAMARLEQSAQFLQKKESRAFYDEISKAMMGYVSDKLQIPKSEMTKSNMKSRLEQLKVAEDRVQQFTDIVKNCEVALYAGKDNAEAMQSTYQNALDVLAEIEKQVGE